MIAAILTLTLVCKGAEIELTEHIKPYRDDIAIVYYSDPQRRTNRGVLVRVDHWNRDRELRQFARENASQLYSMIHCGGSE